MTTRPIRARPTTPARYFFVTAAITMLAVMVAGFHPYYLRGEGLAGRKIAPELATLVFVHGAAMTAWLTTFLVQSRMAYRQFMLVMLSEVALFTLFVLAGVYFRKRPKIHKAMMLLASLSILAGATVRMPVLFPVFGEAGWQGIFGPIFVLGAVFVLVRSIVNRVIDRGLVAGYVVMVVVYIAACEFAVSGAWSIVARAVLNE